MTEPEDPQRRMTVWEHLRELRGILIWCVVFLVIGVGTTALFAGRIFDLLLVPLRSTVGSVELHTFGPAEIVVIYLKISFLGGLILSSPFLLWGLLSFVIPGLTDREQRMILPATIAGMFLFLMGILFAYYVVLPISLKFLWEFNLNFNITPQWRIDNYLSFVLRLCGVFGLMFELPLVITMLAQIGVASPAFLRQKRSYVIVGLVTLSAILTPPDVITQLLMTIPLYLLYEVSILLATLVYPYEH
jgi:sec-independent protein translocase protein TatC